MFKNLSPRGKMFIAGIFLLFVLYLLGANMHAGKTKVAVSAIPDDSAISLDGKHIKAGGVYLKPGNHTFIATRPGFKDDKLVVRINNQPKEVELIPEPNSAEARDLLARNPSIQAAREAIGGRRANERGLELENKTPLIAALPYTDIGGPFSINYGPSPDRKNGTFIVIGDSSPEGRVKALKWIRQQGYNPTDLEIRFSDFANPLVESTENR